MADRAAGHGWMHHFVSVSAAGCQISIPDLDSNRADFYFLYGYHKSHVLLGIDTPSGGENLIEPIRSLVDCEKENGAGGNNPLP